MKPSINCFSVRTQSPCSIIHDVFDGGERTTGLRLRLFVLFLFRFVLFFDFIGKDNFRVVLFKRKASVLDKRMKRLLSVSAIVYEL